MQKSTDDEVSDPDNTTTIRLLHQSLRKHQRRGGKILAIRRLESLQ